MLPSEALQIFCKSGPQVYFYLGVMRIKMEFAFSAWTLETIASSKDKNKQQQGQLVVVMMNSNKENYFNVLTSCTKLCFAKLLWLS